MKNNLNVTFNLRFFMFTVYAVPYFPLSPSLIIFQLRGMAHIMITFFVHMYKLKRPVKGLLEKFEILGNI